MGNLFLVPWPPLCPMPDVLASRPGPGIVEECFAFMGARELARGRSVLVKPNLTDNMAAGTGVTTHLDLVASAVKCMVDSGAKEVVIGEGCATHVRPAYEGLGFYELGEELGIRVVDFAEDEAVDVEVPEPLAVESFSIARTVLDSDFLVNLPVLKIHGGESQVTLCAKNMMGCIAGIKSFMHRDFNRKIIDLLKVVKPDLNIVDGIVGMEGQEIHGTPVGANLLVAGRDFVAVDSVCSLIMGFSPGEVEHIRLAQEHGFGIADPDRITVHGLRVGEVRRHFERAKY